MKNLQSKSMIFIKFKNVNNIKQYDGDRTTLTFDKQLEHNSTLTKLTTKCKCGCSVTIPVYEEKKICNNCGNYVYNNTPMRFKYYCRKYKEGDKNV